MAIFLFDTDMLSLYQLDHPRVVVAVSNLVADEICLCNTTIEEQISGWSKLARSAKTDAGQIYAANMLTELVVSWNEFAIVPMTAPALGRFEVLVRSKLNVRHNDLRIAAVGEELGATVVTRNLRDFGRVPGLRIEDWTV